MEAPNKRNEVSSLTDHVVVEILRRLPARSLCCCKCACRSWNRLISNSDNRKVLPQTVTCFFYEHTWTGVRHFTSLTGERYSLSFLPFPTDNVAILDCCNGLLLCWCIKTAGYCYVVCNPTTQKWLELLPSSRSNGEARLGFDQTVSSHFNVIQYVQDEDGGCVGVEIYSSETAAWIYKESEWGQHVVVCSSSTSVFLNGYLHILGLTEGGFDMVFAVDMEGKTWRNIRMPSGHVPSLHESQGQLCVCTVGGKGDRNKSQNAIWILENYGTDKWKLKHSISTLKVF